MSQRPLPRLDLMPSAADRWMTCAASPRFCLENAHLIPEDLSSKFSMEGNTAHEVAAAFLQDREPDPANCPTPIDAEMRTHAFDYADYVQSLRAPGAGMSKLLVEQKQPLWYYEGRNAIVDAAVINPDSLHIVDFKYGAGVAVSPEHNLQMIVYARQVMMQEIAIPQTASIRELSNFPVFCHIYQPRNRDSDKPEKVWETTWGEILFHSDRIADHAQVIQINEKVKGNPLPFAPSEKACRWCPARAFCPAREHEMLSDFEPLVVKEPETLPMPAALTIEQLAAVLRHGKKIQKWVWVLSWARAASIRSEAADVETANSHALFAFVRISLATLIAARAAASSRAMSEATLVGHLGLPHWQRSAATRASSASVTDGSSFISVSSS